MSKQSPWGPPTPPKRRRVAWRSLVTDFVLAGLFLIAVVVAAMIFEW